MKKLTREQLSLLAEFEVWFDKDCYASGDLVVTVEKHYQRITASEVQKLEALFCTDWEIPVRYAEDEKSQINFYIDRGEQ